MRSRGRMLVLISTIWAQRTKWTLTRALIGGAQPMEGWWAPVAQLHKREMRTSGTNDEIHCCSLGSHLKTLTRSEKGAAAAGSAITPSPACRRHCTAARLRHHYAGSPAQRRPRPRRHRHLAALRRQPPLTRTLWQVASVTARYFSRLVKSSH